MKKIFLGLMLLSAFFVSCKPENMGADTYMGSQAYVSGGSDYRSIAWQDAVKYGINPDLFQRQINQESSWNPDAVSSAGATGIAQIMPKTAASWGVDPYDPVASLDAAADHMSWYWKHYGYNYAKALAAYNCGTACVDGAVANYGDNWRGHIPAETRAYIAIIMGE